MHCPGLKREKMTSSLLSLHSRSLTYEYILEPEAKILMDAQEKEVDKHDDVDVEEEISVEGLVLQEGFEANDDV